jgi:hypothetical protein
MARKKKAAPQAESELGFSGRDLEWRDDPAPVADNKGQEDLTAKLLGQIEALTGQVAQLQGAQAALLAQPQIIYAQPGPMQHEQANDFVGLPDPLDDPDNYNRALNARIDQIVADRLAAYDNEVAAAQNQNATADQLWNDFASTYEEWADQPDRISFAAERVVNRAKARGIDVERYMFVTRDQFFKDVNEEATAVFGERGDEDGDGEVDRSAGLFGATGSPMPSVKTVDQTGSDMLKEITDMQKKTGFY